MRRAIDEGRLADARLIDFAASVAIGGVAAFIMVAVRRNLSLPVAVRPYLGAPPLAFPLFTLAAMALGSFLGRRVLVLYQLTKFALVGGSSFLIDLGVLNVLINLTGRPQGPHATSFKAMSFLVAMSWNFPWNKLWTFGAASRGGTGRQFVEFFIVSSMGLFINVSCFALINNSIGPLGGIPPRTWANIAAGAAAVISPLWNFLGYKFVVFRRVPGEPITPA